MRRTTLLLAGTVFALLPFSSHAQEATWLDDGTAENEFGIDLQLRTRGEYSNGKGTLRKTGTPPAWFVNDRARLSLDYRRGIVSAKVSGQHTGVWGDTSLESTGANFSLNEAWVRLDGREGWFVQVGRQALSYDDERIFGKEDWLTTGFSHDAARLGYERGQHKIHGVVGFNQQKERLSGGTYYDGSIPYKTIQFLWYNCRLNCLPLQFSVMGLNQGMEIGKKDESQERARTGYMQTLGTWARYDWWRLYGTAEAYCQTGHDQNQRRMSACLFAFRLGYEEARYGGTLGFDYVSGSKTSVRKGKNTSFNVLYGSLHERYGAMDYFFHSGGQQSMPTCGVMDFNLGAHARPLKGLSVEADVHLFWMAAKRPKFDRTLGQEIDLRATYRLTRDVTLQAGYSMMLGKKSLTYFKGGNWEAWQDWAFLSMNFSPRLFHTKWK